MQESNNDTKCLSPVKMKKSLVPYATLWMRVRISLGDDHHMMVKNIGSNPIASTNTKIWMIYVKRLIVGQMMTMTELLLHAI